MQPLTGFLLSLMLLTASPLASAEIRYVDRDAPQNGDGLTWGTAYRSLRGPLNEAQGNPDITEIWVAEGTYQTNGTPFQLRDGLSVYGGFVGDEVDRQARDPFAHVVIVDGGGTTRAFNEGNLHGLLFDGLRFRNCRTDQAGGVINFYSGSMTFVNCRFNNCQSTGTPTLPPQGGGGAVAGYEALEGIRFINCVFKNNQTYSRGGAVSIYTGIVELSGCLFIDNRSTNREGGAVYIYEADTTIANCTFIENSSYLIGGAIDNYSSTITMNNSVVWSNSGTCGIVTGCPIGIDWYFWPPEGIPVVSYSITPLAELMGGEAHQAVDPLFLDLDEDWEPFGLSPCVDAGNNALVPRDTWDVDRDGDTSERLPLDCLGNPRSVDAGPAPDTGVWENPFGGEPLTDLGAVEFQDDCNDNGVPDLLDTETGSSEDCDGNGLPDECEIDCDGDGVVDACAVADGLVSDCNTNGIPDSCDVRPSGVSNDLDQNGVPDECEDCNANFLPDALDVRASGDSEDCNGDGVPDECQLGLDVVEPYAVHDNTAEESVGTGQNGWFAWMQHFEADESRQQIDRIGIDFAPGVANQQVRVTLWIDPDGDGNPVDAVRLRTQNRQVQQPALTGLQFFRFNPPISVEPGTSFFAGVYMQLSENAYPAAFDESDFDLGSWVAFNREEFWDTGIGSAALVQRLTDAGISGRWLITADPIYTGGDLDCNENGVPDHCDIEDGTEEDADFDGIPDACEGGADCLADLDGDGTVGGSDLGIVFLQWGEEGSADFDGDGVVGGSDLGIFFIRWGDCP